MAEKKRLSLCMITKNDEKHLANCLQELKEVVAEIIIVDIGSRDQTIAIAKQAGAKVYQMKWKNNYSEAKNLCLDQANGRWILFLQANETISTEQLKLINPLLDNPNVEGYLLYLDHPSENYRISSPVQSLRLVRNRKEYRYQYKAWERIPDELLTNIKDAGIRIVQQAEPTLSREIYSLTMLLQEDLKEHPEDSYLQYMYGIELLNQKRYGESVVHFQKARKNVNLGYLFAPHLVKCLSWALISLERPTEALDVLEEGIKYFSYYTDLLVLRGELRKQFQQYGEAIQDLESSLKIRQQPNAMVPRPEINISIILETLGEIHEEAFNCQQALACYQQAYELNKTNQKLLAKIGALGKRVGSTAVLENLLQAAMEQNNLEQLMIMMDILFQQREYHKVLAQLEQLESVLGKDAQTASIKFCCYLMLGDVAEAELYFSAIGKDSPCYHHLLLQRIESYWSDNQWQEADQLLKEMDQLASMENQIKALYQLFHGLFTGEERHYPALTQQEYEIARTVLENFLWLEQVEKAQILLPLLLPGATEEQYIKLAELWAERNDCQTIAMIFQCMTSKQKQLEFKQKIIRQLLHHDHLETAQQLMKLGDSQPLGAIAYVLWSKCFIKKLEEWTGKVHRSTTRAGGAGTLAPQTPAKPSKALLAFYYSLDLAKNNMNENTLEDSAAELTCTKIHGEIGGHYAKLKQKKEALSAYLRALQWDPLDDLAQEKIRALFHENPNQIRAYLEKKGWILEGSWFHHQQEFINFILGLMDFKNQQFEQALASFSNIAEDEASCLENNAFMNIASAYMISSFWLAGKEAEAERRLAEQSRTAEIFSSFFRICQNYALDRLREGHQQYPYSELIMGEQERVSNRSVERRFNIGLKSKLKYA
jgi:glycosyltransferase involved in cell wall biosynthesis